jgi:pentatricopeptide repeat protein
MWTRALEIARTIESRYLRSKTLYALTLHAPEDLRAQLALETIRTLWEVSGGLTGAERLLQTMVAMVGPELRMELFGAWRQFLRSLSRSSWQEMLRDLASNRCVLEALGSDNAATGAVTTLQSVERWWGKQSDNPKEEEENADRFSDELVPANAVGSEAAVLGLLVEGQQFERAERMLEACAAKLKNEDEPALHTMKNQLLYGWSAAGKLDAATRLLSGLSDPSDAALQLLIQRLIAYGRVDEARKVLDRIRADSGDEAAVPFAALLMESYVAEDRWTDGQVLFESIRMEELGGGGLRHYIDMGFMLVNCLLRSGELQRAEQVIRQMKNEEDGELGEFLAQQFSQLSAKIRNADRVAFWTRACDYLRQKS